MAAPVSKGPRETRSFQDVSDFYLRHDKEGVYKWLTDLRIECWQDPKGDVWFQDRRKAADEATATERLNFYYMMKAIGKELEEKNHIFSQFHRERCTQGQNVKVLDLCMAPGGYTASALDHLPFAKACGITLPTELGGHPVVLGEKAVRLEYLDLTMLMRELMAPCGEDADNSTVTIPTTSTPAPTSTQGDDRSTPELDPSLRLPAVPADHPDAKNFNSARPFVDTVFNLIFCDGQVLRTHPRQSYRERVEARRLLISQVIVALQRLPPVGGSDTATATANGDNDGCGGTVVVLLHKLDKPYTVQFLYLFSRFADIELFKPTKTHALRSSFYLVAKNVRARSPEALQALRYWKRVWWNATFENGGLSILEMSGKEEEMEKKCELLLNEMNVDGSVEDRLDSVLIMKQRMETLRILDVFGEKLIELARPLWLIQIQALRRKLNDGFAIRNLSHKWHNRKQN